MESRWNFVWAFGAGALVCGLLSAFTGNEEAWDSPLYFLVGLPILCGVSTLLAWRAPKDSWLWVIGIVLGQSSVMLTGSHSWNLFPLTLAACTILAIPLFVVSLLASSIRNRA